MTRTDRNGRQMAISYRIRENIRWNKIIDELTDSSVLTTQAKPDLSLRDRRESLHVLDFVGEAVDVLHRYFDHRGRTLVATLQLLHAGGNVPIGFDELAQAHERTNDGDAHLDRSFTA